MKKLGFLTCLTFLLWAVLIYPGWLLWGEAAWIQSTVALGLCLLPALATLAWALKTGAGSEKQLVAVLAGTGIRMLVALGGGLLLYKILPETFTDIFWLWMAFFYMFILTLETILIVKNKHGGLLDR